MNIFKRIEQWFRRQVLNPGKRAVARELSDNLERVVGAIDQAAIRWAAQTGGEPLAFFVGVALDELQLSASVRRFLEGLLPRLGAGSSRATTMGTQASRETVARRDIAPLLAAIREEAAKA